MKIIEECYYDCLNLTHEFSLAECLIKCKDFCELLETDDFWWVKDIMTTDPCIKNIRKLAAGKWGARQVYAMLLLIAGDVVNADLQIAAYKYEADKTFQELIGYLGIKTIPNNETLKDDE